MTIQGDSTHSSATGLYLLAQEVQHDGNLTSLEACGYFNNTKSSFQTRNSTSFYIIVYRSMDGKYVRIYKPYVFVHDINGNETFGCYEHNVTKQELILLTGDRIGVFVPETECFNFDLKNSCTYGFHVNIIDPIVNSSQVYYVVNSSDFTMKEFPQVLNLKDIQSANIFINMELCFSVTSSTSAIPATIRSEIIAIPASVGITIVMIVMLLVLVTGVVVGHHRRTRGGTKEQETTVTVIDASVATDAERTYSHLNYRIYNHQDGFLNGEPTMNRKMVKFSDSL